MSIIRNNAGEVRLGWRLVLVIFLFVAAEILLRFIPIRLITVVLVWKGVAWAEAIEKAGIIVSEGPVVSTVIGILVGLAAFLIVWFMVRVIERSSLTCEAVGLDWRKSSPWSILLGAILVLGLFGSVALTRQILGHPSSWMESYQGSVSVPILFKDLLFFIAMVFAERIVFMGYIQTRLVERHGATWGILITAVVFVLLHQLSYNLTPILIVSGLMLWATIGVLYQWSKSLYLVISFHALMNTLMNSFDLDFGDLSSMIVYSLALALVLITALVRSRGSCVRQNRT